MDIGGIPLEHQEERVARIFRPAREATQTPWNNTTVRTYIYKIYRRMQLYLYILRYGVLNWTIVNAGKILLWDGAVRKLLFLNVV